MGTIFSIGEAEDKHFCWGLFAGQLKSAVEDFLHGALLACQAEAVGADWHKRSPSRDNYRNGYRRRSLETRYGSLNIKVPRNRKGGYLHGVFDAFSRRTEELDREIMDAFGLGLSTRGLSRWLRRCGVGLSPQGVANVVAQADAAMRAWHRRSLRDDRWQFVFLDGMWVREGREKRVVLVAVGVTADWATELIDYRVAEGESFAAWDGLLRDMYGRGFEGKGTRLFVSDGGSAIEGAIAENFPGKPHQECAFHKIQDIGEHLWDHRNRRAILRDAARIYRAGTARDAVRRAGRWADRWVETEPEAVRLFLEGIEKTLVYYAFEKRAWRKIRTSNVVERYLRELRRRLKTISAYRNEESIDRMVFAAVNGIATRGYPYGPKKIITHNA